MPDDMKPRMRDSADAATPASAGWQAQKSASTRLQIVESALRCVVDLGYSCTTTTVIADKAGLSRGAMLHHFPSKIDIVRAAVEHLHAKRLKAFRRAIDKLPRDETRVRRALIEQDRDVLGRARRSHRPRRANARVHAL
jgi:AcrR family transcriptional regulator